MIKSDQDPVRQTQPLVASSAFQRETMRSERIRIIGILSVLGAVFVFAAGRSLILGQSVGQWAIHWTGLLLQSESHSSVSRHPSSSNT